VEVDVRVLEGTGVEVRVGMDEGEQERRKFNRNIPINMMDFLIELPQISKLLDIFSSILKNQSYQLMKRNFMEVAE
jgi:hypothetical protein